MSTEQLLAETKLIRGLLTALLMERINAAEGTKRDAIALLHAAGLAPKEIAELVESTPNAVSVAISDMKRAKGKAKSAGKK
ncbi:MAG: hypothetical protein AB7F65_06750 [Dehalococcoidia bacterium]